MGNRMVNSIRNLRENIEDGKAYFIRKAWDKEGNSLENELYVELESAWTYSFKIEKEFNDMQEKIKSLKQQLAEAKDSKGPKLKFPEKQQPEAAGK